MLMRMVMDGKPYEERDPTKAKEDFKMEANLRRTKTTCNQNTNEISNLKKSKSIRVYKKHYFN